MSPRRGGAWAGARAGVPLSSCMPHRSPSAGPGAAPAAPARRWHHRCLSAPGSNRSAHQLPATRGTATGQQEGNRPNQKECNRCSAWEPGRRGVPAAGQPAALVMRQQPRNIAVPPISVGGGSAGAAAVPGQPHPTALPPASPAHLLLAVPLPRLAAPPLLFFLIQAAAPRACIEHGRQRSMHSAGVCAAEEGAVLPRCCAGAGNQQALP